MSVLLPSPSPPQIMLLIINRMRACSSWKAGTGTSLLNGAAQLGLKLFNRNTKAPSVQRIRPSEVTACCPSPASTPVPPAPSPLPSRQDPRCTPSSSHHFFTAKSLSPCYKGVFLCSPQAKAKLQLSFRFPETPDFPIAAQFASQPGCPIFVRAAKPFTPAHCAPCSPSCPSEEAELSCAHLGSTKLEFEGEKLLLRGLRGGTEPRAARRGAGGRWQQPGLVSSKFRG